jgi:hypothetical protein
MGGPRAIRLVQTVLRCYPARWRRRHGDEAAELAALLIRDGTPAHSVALSYLLGAVRERLTPRPGPRLRTAMCALLVVACSLGASVGMLTSTVPARAASTSRAGERAHHCRPVLVGPVRHEKPASDHPQPGTREAGASADGRSC